MGVHNHRPVLSKIEASKVITAIKRKAEDTVETRGQIIAFASVGMHLSVAAKLPNIELLKKTVRRVRTSKNDGSSRHLEGK